MQDGTAAITAKNLIETVPGGRPVVRFVFPETSQAPILSDTQTGPAQAMLRRLYATGQAAGHVGDLYDNRDRKHSNLPIGNFPQLARIAYDPVLRAESLDYGAALGVIFDAPVLGNSSTALTSGPLWRSQARYMLTLDGGPRALFQNYASNQIHLYPEHRDHDPERGDLLTANTPYYLTSQGSSSSDQPHMTAVAMILAAFRPDTKAMLRDRGLIAPTVQMVYRRARDGVLSREAYLSGAAHPPVFEAKGINLARMVGLANAIAPEDVPPMVRLDVVEESWTADEALFDTPAAIARVWRDEAFMREMVVSAGATQDPNERALTFDWVLLQGDPERVEIEPLDATGQSARITVSWQEPRVAVSGLISPRIDIGIFAHNGAFDSAPGFVSILLPAHERRVYDGAALKLRERRDEVYADPLVFAVGE